MISIISQIRQLIEMSIKSTEAHITKKSKSNVLNHRIKNNSNDTCGMSK